MPLAAFSRNRRQGIRNRATPPFPMLSLRHPRHVHSMGVPRAMGTGAMHQHPTRPHNRVLQTAVPPGRAQPVRQSLSKCMPRPVRVQRGVDLGQPHPLDDQGHGRHVRIAVAGELPRVFPTSLGGRYHDAARLRLAHSRRDSVKLASGQGGWEGCQSWGIRWAYDRLPRVLEKPRGFVTMG